MRTVRFRSLQWKAVLKLLGLVLLASLAILVWVKPRVGGTAGRSRSSGPIQVRRSGMSALVVYDGSPFKPERCPSGAPGTGRLLQNSSYKAARLQGPSQADRALLHDSDRFGRHPGRSSIVW